VLPACPALPKSNQQYHAAAGDAADLLEGDGRALASVGLSGYLT